MTPGGTSRSPGVGARLARVSHMAVRRTHLGGWGAALVAALTVAAVMVAGALMIGRTKTAGPGGPGAPTAADASHPGEVPWGAGDRAALRALLDRRAQALRARDVAGWLAGVDPRVPEARRAEQEVWRSLTALPVSSWSWHVDDQAAGVPCPGQSGSGCLRVTGAVRWMLDGHDAQPVEASTTLVVRRDRDRWWLSGVQTSPCQVWDLPRLQASPGPEALVVGDVPQARLVSLHPAVAAARRQVEEAWGPLGRPPVVVVPSTDAWFASLVGLTPERTRQTAAMTYGRLQSGQPARGDRVYLDPDGWARLSDQGRQIVLAHELTHLAVRGSTRHGVPEWLSEGFAVHVSYRGLDVDPRRTARELLDAVRAGRGPSALPADDRFADAGSGQAYDEAWLLVEHLVRLRGEPAVVRFYRDLADGRPATESWARLGVTPATALRGWREDLTRLAAGRR